MLGKAVVVLAANYIYAGVLAAYTHEHVVLTDAKIVYETGAWDRADRSSWKSAEKLPIRHLFIERSAIESWGEST